MEIRQVRLSDVDVEPLLAGLSDEYDTRYGKNIEMTRANEDEFDHPHGLFVVLMDGPITAAGGGFRRYNQSTCEVRGCGRARNTVGTDWRPGCCDT